MYRSIFSDELYCDAAKALPILAGWGSTHVDFRALINGKGIEFQTDEELRALKRRMDELGLKTGALETSLCKVHFPGPERQKQEMEKLEGIIRAANILGCPLVRSFNYWQPHGDSTLGTLVVRPDEMARVLEMFSPVANRAREAGLILAFENCGQTADEVIALTKALGVPGWGLAWDAHNDFECLPLNPDDAVDYYERCLEYTRLIHVKATSIVPDLEGLKLPWDRILRGAAAAGRDFPVSVETHNPKGSPLTHEEATRKTFDLIGQVWPSGAPSSVREGLKPVQQFIRPYNDDPVRFVVVGLGMGRFRSKQLTETSGCRLYGVVDINAEKAKTVGEELGVPSSSDITVFLKDPAVEVMYVVTPTGLHAEVAEQCLRAGKHVLTTKPMDVSAENCRRLIETAKQCKRLLAVDFDLRQDEVNLSLKKAVDSGWFGRLLSINSSLYVQRQDPYFLENGGWRGTWRYDGGGAMCNQGVHEVDRLQFIAGMPKRVRAATKTQTHKIEVEDIGLTEWDYGGDQMVRFYATTSYPLSAWYVRIELHGTEGAFVYSGGGPEKEGFHYGKDGKWSEVQPYPVAREWRQASDAFASSVRTGTPLRASGEEGIKSRQLLDVLYESARKGGVWVTL
jgi:predicted dehydrogenase/sugar phosphate isomerase/epimerase